MIISSSIGRGGADRQLLNLAYRLNARSYPLKIISLSPLGIMGYEGIENGLDISCINLKEKRIFPFELLKIFLLMAVWRPRIVVTFMFHASMIGRLARMLFLVQRHISSVRNERIGGRRREKLFRFTNLLDDVTTVNSRNAAGLLIGDKVLDKRRTVVIPNSIAVEKYECPDTDRYSIKELCGLEGNRFVWIIVARFVENKDYDTLLQATRLLVQSGTNPLLRIVGVGRLCKQIKKTAHDLHLHDHVEFLGARADIPELLNAADCFVLSSAWEGMPNVILEAMAASLPVVASNVGGVSELIVHNETGFLVEPGNPNELCRYMKRMMELPPEERERMGARGHDYVLENHSIASITDLWIGTFQRK